MKIKQKIIFDIGMAILFVFCMKYRFTGNLLHEVLGIVLILGFIVHVSINHKYYKAIFQNKNMNSRSPKQILSLIINTILLLAIPVMAVSSVMISRDVLSFMNLHFDGHGMWRTVHIISAVVLFSGSLVHLLLHMPLFKGMIGKNVNRQDFEKVWNMGSRVVAVLMSIFVVFTSIRVSKNAIGIGGGHHGDRQHEQGYMTDRKPKEQDAITNGSSDQEDDTDLNEYLGSLTCHGCGRGCSLLTPQCMKGVRQAEQAKETFESESGTDDGVY